MGGSSVFLFVCFKYRKDVCKVLSLIVVAVSRIWKLLWNTYRGSFLALRKFSPKELNLLCKGLNVT